MNGETLLKSPLLLPECRTLILREFNMSRQGVFGLEFEDHAGRRPHLRWAETGVQGDVHAPFDKDRPPLLLLTRELIANRVIRFELLESVN